MLRNQPERSRDDRSRPNHIPLDLTLEILSRLPAKSIVRYQCVSKLWSSLITLPSLINSFESRSSSQPPRLLITVTLQGKKHFVLSFPQNQNPEGSDSPVYNLEPKLASDFNLTTSPRAHPHPHLAS
ncbi:hypothetical protein Rs2_36934 [Raphanus sativus]|nr:hypothetical protein Rs2_48792 [Raphanus sativus]KAJ4879880.1 hypothetical protein Rs2_36934 [Raphanus sativus]